MKVGISPDNKPSSITSSPNFNGLTKCLKNKIYLDGQKDISNLLKKHPNTYQGVGELPNYIFKNLPKENLRSVIREILGAFDEVANSIRGYIPEGQDYIFDSSKRHRPEKANKILTDVLRKYNVLKRWDDDINLKYLGQGGKGKVFKIDGLRDADTEDEYVIKVFHLITAPNWHPYKSHGCYAEINSGIYWKNHEGMDTQRGKFFFGNLKSGFIVSKYLDEDVPLPKRNVPEYKYGIKCTDEDSDPSKNVVGYNCLKGYFYDYGGMRVVNRLKNSDKIARQYLQKIKEQKPENRSIFWENHFSDRTNTASKDAGLALGIKYMENKNFYIDRCLALNIPKVNQALGYVLKYLPYEDSVRYFEKLMKTNDETTQIILLNEIPLLSKRKDAKTEIKDDINSTLKEIIPERVYKYYKIAEKHTLPTTVEHLASFVHLLPMDKIKEQYLTLTYIQNPLLQERLMWKMDFLPKDFQNFAMIKLANAIKDKTTMSKLIDCSQTYPEEIKKYVKECAHNLDKEKGLFHS